MRSLLLNFIVALLLFGGIVWFFVSRQQAEIGSMTERYDAGGSGSSSGPGIEIKPGS